MYAKKGSNSSAVDANAPTLKTPVANRENASKDSIRQTSEKSQEKVSASDREYLELAEDPENNEAAAIITAPYVLKRGFAISGHKNHKYKGYPSVTFAGKVEINGAEGIVGVCSICG
jgi:hypothetical protein